jgi:hypothetical protein
MAGRRAVWRKGVHDILLLRCPSDTLENEMKRKKNNEVECVSGGDAEESDEPVTVVCSRYEREEGKPLSLIRTCQEPVLAKSHSEDNSAWKVEVDNLPASRIFGNELDGLSSSACICNRVFLRNLGIVVGFVG